MGILRYKMAKYGYVYSIRSFKTDKIYIGSTTELSLSKRMSRIRSEYKIYAKAGLEKNHPAYEILQHPDAYIEVIQRCEAGNWYGLKKCEHEVIRSTDCLNKQN
jgi:hypothetical protein